MAQIRLQRPGVGALVRQRVARGMAQHVRMDLKGHLGRAATAGRLIQTTPRGRFCVAQSTLIHTNPQCDADHLFAPSPPTGLLGQANQSPGPFLLELKTFRQ